MKRFNLDEYLKNPSRRVVTRDGRSVKIHCTNYIGTQPIIAAVEDSEYSTAFCKDGRSVIGEETPNDLFFAPERKEGWVNVYREDNQLLCGTVYNTESEARQHSRFSGYPLATAKIEWEE